MSVNEEEICPVCLEKLPHWENKFIRLVCCGKALHITCDVLLCESEYGETCPMCRATVDVSDEETHARCLIHATGGKAWAMLRVADDYTSGEGVNQSDEQVRFWTKQAVAKGSAIAMYNMGTMHLYGTFGYLKDKEKARIWFQLSAQLGFPTAISQSNWMDLLSLISSDDFSEVSAGSSSSSSSSS